MGSIDLVPECYIYLVEYVVKPLLNTEPNEAVIGKEAPNWHRLAGILDARVWRNPNGLAGDTVTIADIAVAAPMHVHKAQRLSLEDHRTSSGGWRMSKNCHAGRKRKAPPTGLCGS